MADIVNAVNGSGIFLLDAIRLYRDYRREKLADRILITSHEMYWRNVQPTDKKIPPFNRQYLLLESAKVNFYLYIVNLKNDQTIKEDDTFDNVYFEKCGHNVVAGSEERKPEKRMHHLPFYRSVKSSNTPSNGGDQIQPEAPTPDEKFCYLVESVLYDTLHYALTIDDLSPNAIISIINYAHYLVLNLGNDEGPQTFTTWEKEDGVRCMHAMIVVKSDFECKGFEGPLRLKLLQSLASLTPLGAVTTVEEAKNAAQAAQASADKATAASERTKALNNEIASKAAEAATAATDKATEAINAAKAATDKAATAAAAATTKASTAAEAAEETETASKNAKLAAEIEQEFVKSARAAAVDAANAAAEAVAAVASATSALKELKTALGDVTS